MEKSQKNLQPFVWNCGRANAEVFHRKISDMYSVNIKENSVDMNNKIHMNFLQF